MHDKNGRQLYLGDQVRVKIYPERYVVGVIQHASPETKTCNLTIAYLVPGAMAQACCTASETELIATRDGELPEVRPTATPVAAG